MRLKTFDKAVDFKVPWGYGHDGDYDLPELFAWTDRICKIKDKADAILKEEEQKKKTEAANADNDNDIDGDNRTEKNHVSMTTDTISSERPKESEGTATANPAKDTTVENATVGTITIKSEEDTSVIKEHADDTAKENTVM